MYILNRTFLFALPIIFLTACGDDAPPEQKKADNADVDRELIDLINRTQPPEIKEANLIATPATLSFSTIRVGDELNLPIVLTNDGDKPLTIEDVRLASEEDVFSLENQCRPGQVLEEGKKICRINVTFVPGQPRQYKTTVIITHTAPESPMLIELMGNGEEPPAPEQQVYIPPAAPAPPSPLWLNSQRLQQQRGTGTLKVLQTGVDLGDVPYTSTSPGYGELGFPATESTLPVNRTRMITMDRYIPAVLESTINSQLSGGRAVGVIETNVYSAEGRNILIPAGSRMTGTYQSLTQQGNTRLGVVWSRLIRPDGVGINLLNAPSMDVMGRMGLIGQLDNRYFDRFALPLLISTLGIAANYAASDGTVVTRGFGDLGSDIFSTVRVEEISREEFAARQFADELLKISAQLIKENIDIRPVITVPAGTRFNVIPTQDIILRKPTQMVGLANQNNLAARASELIRTIQRGENSETAVRLAEILGSVAEAGAQNEQNALSGPYSSPALGAGAQNFGPPALQ